VAPTTRESDGLAMSSRNRYLQPEERAQATVLWRSQQWVRQEVRRCAQGIPSARLRQGVEALVAECPAARLDYVAFVDPDTLRPVDSVRRGHRIVLAVFVGKTRLIDNGGI